MYDQRVQLWVNFVRCIAIMLELSILLWNDRKWNGNLIFQKRIEKCVCMYNNNYSNTEEDHSGTCSKSWMYNTLYFPAIFVTIDYMDNIGKLYCTSEDWFESQKEATPFCIIMGKIIEWIISSDYESNCNAPSYNTAGAVYYYVLLQLAVFWFYNVSVLFWKIRSHSTLDHSRLTISCSVVLVNQNHYTQFCLN